MTQELAVHSSAVRFHFYFKNNLDVVFESILTPCALDVWLSGASSGVVFTASSRTLAQLRTAVVSSKMTWPSPTYKVVKSRIL